MISTIADIIKIWRTGRLYMLPAHEKARALALVIAEIENKQLTPPQLVQMESLRNSLEG